MGNCLMNQILFQPPDQAWARRDLAKSKDVSFITKPNGDKLCVMHINVGSNVTLLHSHGNAEDISLARSFFFDIAVRMRVNVVAYDYSGYGLSDGTPSERAVYQDADLVYDHVTSTLGVPPHRLILWGRSLGSGPTSYLAEKHYPNYAGVIIVSGFTSCFAVVSAFLSKACACWDYFPNARRLRAVREKRILIMHGMEDVVVPFQLGWQLQKQVSDSKNGNQVMFQWFNDRGHNDILEFPDTTHQYLSTFRKFVDSIREDVRQKEEGSSYPTE